MGGLFSKPKVTKPKPTRMAVPDSAASKAAKASAQEEARRRRGRESTNLEGEGTSLGQ